MAIVSYRMRLLAALLCIPAALLLAASPAFSEGPGKADPILPQQGKADPIPPQQGKDGKAAPAAFSAHIEALTAEGKPGGEGPVSFSGTCPATVKFKGRITSPKAGNVTYLFVRSDGAKTKPATMKFDKAGSQELETTWKLGKGFSGWLAIEVESPHKFRSNQAKFEVVCSKGASAPPQAGTPGKKGGAVTDSPQGSSVAPPVTDSPQGSSSVVVPGGKKGVKVPSAAAVAAVAGTKKTPPTQECVNFASSELKVAPFKGQLGIVDPKGYQVVGYFGNNQANADRALAVIQNYNADLICFIGGRGPKGFKFLLARGGDAISGPMAGEDCISFSPDSIDAKQINGEWKIADGENYVFGFGKSETNARHAAASIKKYGYNQICFVGNPRSSFHYLRK